MVPEGWQRKTLGELISGTIKNGYSPVAAESDTGYWVMGLGALGESRLNPSEIKPVEPTDKVKSCLLKKDDFLVSRSNTPYKVGRSLRFRGDVVNCSYPDLMMRFRVDERIVDPGFIEHKLKSHDIRTYFKRSAAGSSGTMVKINKSVLEATPVIIPNVPEQQKIAKILTTWDEAIATTEQLLAHSEQQKKALMQQLLTGKKRLPGFEGKWDWLKARDLFQSVSKRNNAEDEPLLAVTQEQGVLPRSMLDRRVVMPGGSTSGYKLVKPGDFIISLRSFQGGLEYSSFRGLVSPAYTVLEATEKANDGYFKHYFKSQYFIGRLAVAVIGIRDGKQVSYSDFSFLKMPCPSLAEQSAIAKALDKAEDEVVCLRETLDHLKAEKRALMQQLLTGKRRVKVAEAEPATA